MEKNENGYPQSRSTGNNRNGTGNRADTPMDHINRDGLGDGRGNMNGTGRGMNRMGCPMDEINDMDNGTMNGRSGENNGNGWNNRGNMNGTYPRDNANNGNGCLMGRNGTRSGSHTDDDAVPHSHGNGCGPMADDCLDSRSLAYVYAPKQRFCMLYSAKDALDHGTLFEALYKPMEVYGRE